MDDNIDGIEIHKFGGDETIAANDSERPFKGCYAPDAAGNSIRRYLLNCHRF